jgi:hypothetical protein
VIGPAPAGVEDAVAQPVDVPGFRHLHAGHCESGVTALLFREAGLDLGEPMAFGIGAGLFFAHFSFFRVMGHPLTTFRSFPGSIFRGACRRLGATYHRQSFRDPSAGMAALDEALASQRRVGLQLNIYWLPYIPRAMRVHFNGHNVVVLERRGDDYVVSDPVMDVPLLCPVDALRRARFSGSHRFLPRGLMYWIEGVPRDVDLRGPASAGIAEVSHRMTRIPRVIPWLGARGIEHLASRLPRWPAMVGEERAREWLAGVVRMQEEVGTGGAGFRYLYAAFLQSVARRDDRPDLERASEMCTALGDRWREFAVSASRLARGRQGESWAVLSERLRDLAADENTFFSGLTRRGG